MEFEDNVKANKFREQEAARVSKAERAESVLKSNKSEQDKDENESNKEVEMCEDDLDNRSERAQATETKVVFPPIE